MMTLMLNTFAIVKGWSYLGLHCVAKCLTVPKLVYKVSIFPGAMIPVHISLNVI